MSLINRMLGDLAARQAPGAEALGGVRLNEPLADASASLSSRTVAMLVAVAVLSALLAWWLWPKAVSIPAPRVRGVDAAAPVPVSSTKSTMSPSSGGATLNSMPAMPTRLSLKLDTQLASTASGTARVNAIEAATPSVIEAAPRAERGVRPPPPMRAETSLAWSGDASPSNGSRSNSNSQRGKSSTSRKQSEPVPAKAAAPLVVEQPITARKLRARTALGAGDPATALEALGSTANDTDTEIAALRAAALQRLGRHPDAARSYERLAGLEPDEAAHWVGLAISLESLRRRDEARAAYQRGLSSPRIATSLQAFARARLTAMEKP